MLEKSTAIPMRTLSPLSNDRLALTDTAAHEYTQKRSKSLPATERTRHPQEQRPTIGTALEKIPKRSISLPVACRSAISVYGSHNPEVQQTSTAMKEDLSTSMVNDFLEKAGLDMTLREGRLFITRHRDPEATEAQRSPTVKDLSQVCRALMIAETPAKLDIAAALLPAIHAQLLEHIEASSSGGNLKDKVKDFAKAYCAVLGGRDLAIDDAIATVNAYFFDKIGQDSTLRISNIAAAALTAVLMLIPTIGKNLPALIGAIREKRYRDAIMPALSISAIAAMTLNPTAAAMGLNRTSAIAAATGNALMMANLPEILHHGYEWTNLRRANLNPEAHPFMEFSRNHGLVDQGLHTALDFLHEFSAQAGFLVLNAKNAIELQESTRSPAVFPILATLLGSFAVDTIRGDQPFSDFALSREALVENLNETAGNHDVHGQAAMHFLQQKIAETYNTDYGSLISPQLRTSVGRHIFRQLGGNTLSDVAEKEFLKGLLGQFIKDNKKAKDAAHVAIDRIYRFDEFDPAANSGDNRLIAEILRFVQTQRNKDKAFLGDTRGFARADHVYRNVIAHAIKCSAFEELGRQL